MLRSMSVPSVPPLQSARLLDQVRERVRYLHYSLRTEQAGMSVLGPRSPAPPQVEIRMPANGALARIRKRRRTHCAPT